jgi:hypothetical protein
VRAAATLTAIEAGALLITALILVVLTFTHTTTKLWAALSIVGFALLGAAILALGSRGLVHLRPSARTPVLLIQLLTLPVSYSLGVQSGRWLIGLPMLLCAVSVIVLLFTPSARMALDRVP